MFVCKECGFSSGSVPSVLAHLKNHGVHKHLDKFACFQLSCNSLFSTYSNLRKHLYLHVRRNSQEIDLTVTFAEVPQSSNNSEAINFLLNEFQSINSVQLETVCDSISDGKYIQNFDCMTRTADDFRFDITEFAAKEFSGLYQDPTLTKKNVQTFCTKLESIANAKPVHQIHNKIISLIKKSNMDSDEVKEIESCLQLLTVPLYDINTDFKRTSYFKKVDTLLDFHSFTIFNLPKKNSKGFEEQTPCKAYYFKIEEILKKFFSLPNVYQTVIDFMDTADIENENVLSSYLTSENWKNKKKHFAGKRVVPLALYMDDFEPNNVIGSHSTLYKIGGVYISIPALPLSLATQIKNIFVASLHFSDDRAIDRQEYGLTNILRPVIESLKSLSENGIDIELPNGATEKLYFCLAYIHGDNLGLNEILGFRRSFRCDYYCRVCKASKKECWKLCKEVPELLRNRENYENDLLTNDVKKTGIESKCCLHDSDLLFDVTENCVLDAMHDLLEGVCKYDVAYILLDMIVKKKYFSVETLNYRMEYFDYGHNDSSNKPIGFDLAKLKKLNVKMSAAEMLTFVRYAPLIFGDLVPEDSKSWQLFLLMREIVFLIIAPAIKKESLIYLATLIEEHNMLFQKLFDTHLRPKFHFLTHYPSIIRLSGPPVFYWSMRQEAKHKDSKLYCKINANRMNVLKSVCWKHQMQLNDRFLKDEGFPLDEEITLPKNRQKISIELAKEYGIETNVDQYCMVNKIQVSNIIYKKNGVLMTDDEDEDDFPVFLLIEKIIVNKCDPSKIYFLCTVLKTNNFDEHFQSYNITKSTTKVTKSLKDRVSFHPLYLCKSCNGKFFVVHRCAL